MNKHFLIIFFGLSCLQSSLFSQQAISKYEKCWAICHPIAAFKIKQKLPLALSICNKIKTEQALDQFESGGKLDAFRHVYTMAYLSQTLSIKKLRKLGIAHEKGNRREFEKKRLEFGERPDSLACDMDLKNNELGFSIGKTYKFIGMKELKDTVIMLIKQGEAWYLKRNNKGNYTDCEGRDIDLVLYKDKWFIPKCLIKTNE